MSGLRVSERSELDAPSRGSEAIAGEESRDAIVDVGIPTLGTSLYLAESIESILSQTLASWRLVISENGPGLESVRRALEPYLQDSRIRHVVTETRVGRGTNHNKLVQAGSAPYVGILHDDDRWHPQFLERRIEFLEAHPTCGLVFSGHVVIDEDGTPLGRTKPVLEPGVSDSAEVLPRLYQRNFIGCPTVVVRRSAYEVVPGYRDILAYDWPMWLQLAARYDVGFLQVWDADYRIHGGQASANRARLAEEDLQVLEATEGLPIGKSLRRRTYASAYVRCGLDAVERGDRHDALAHLARAMRIDPLSMFRPTIAARMAAALAALTTGERGRRKLTHVRERRWRTGGAQGLLDMPKNGTPGRSRVGVPSSGVRR